MKEELERTLKIKAFDSSGSLLAFTAFAGLCSAAFLAPTPASSIHEMVIPCILDEGENVDGCCGHPLHVGIGSGSQTAPVV